MANKSKTFFAKNDSDFEKSAKPFAVAPYFEVDQYQTAN